MKKSYRWLFIFMIMAALSACTDHEDHLYGAAGAGGEAVNPEATSEDALVLKSVTKYAFEPAVTNSTNIQRTLLGTGTFEWEFSQDEIVITGAFSTELLETVGEGLWAFLNQRLELGIEELDLTGSPFFTGTLRTNYQGQILACELDLSKIEFQRTAYERGAGPQPESAGTLLLKFAHDASGQISQVAISKDGNPIGTLQLTNTYAAGKLIAQLAKYQPNGSPETRQAYATSFTYNSEGQLVRIEVMHGTNPTPGTITSYTYSEAGKLESSTTEYFDADDTETPHTRLTNYYYANGNLARVEKQSRQSNNELDEPRSFKEFTYLEGEAGVLTGLDIMDGDKILVQYDFEWIQQSVPAEAKSGLNRIMMSAVERVLGFCDPAFTRGAHDAITSDFLRAVYRPAMIVAD